MAERAFCQTMRGKILSLSTTQVNLKVVKSGAKALAEVFPEQNQPKAEPEWKKKKEVPVEAKPAE